MKFLVRAFKAWLKNATCTHPNRAAIVRMHSYYHLTDIDAHGGRRSRWQCLLCGEDRLYSWHPEYYVAEKGDLVKWNFPRQVAVVLALLLVSSAALAQTPVVVTPTTALYWQPSPDHGAVDPTFGYPLLLAYEVRWATTQTGCGALPPISVGKPPVINGELTTGPWAVLQSIPPNCAYTIRLWAVGQGGIIGPMGSNPTVPFVLSQPRAPAPPPGIPVLRESPIVN